MPMTPRITAASKSHERYDACPHCGGTDIRGPHDTTPHPITKQFRRAWFCRSCWWDKETILCDDSAAAAGG